MNSKDRQKLKAMAHALSPVIILGANGLTDAVHAELEKALNSHELIKVRVNAEDNIERELLIEEICEVHQAELIQKIGHVIVIFRENPEKDLD